MNDSLSAVATATHHIPTLLDKLTELSITCGMNQRYWQEAASNAASVSQGTTAIDCIVAAAALFFVALLILMGTKTPAPTEARTAVRVFAGFFASATMGCVLLTSFSDVRRDSIHSAVMFQGWSDLRLETDAAIADLEAAGGDEQGDSSGVASGPHAVEAAQKRYRELLAKKESINAREPALDTNGKANLLNALKEEEKSRGISDD